MPFYAKILLFYPCPNLQIELHILRLGQGSNQKKIIFQKFKVGRWLKKGKKTTDYS